MDTLMRADFSRYSRVQKSLKADLARRLAQKKILPFGKTAYELDDSMLDEVIAAGNQPPGRSKPEYDE